MEHLTSIVILTRNELAYTRRCVESIARWTPEPYELVFVDNGSTDGTPEYLASLPGATVILNEANLGFAGGCNQGIAAGKGERILLLNNDTMATPGWLKAMHAALDADGRRGIVGPRSNNVGGNQIVDDVGYDVDTADGLDEYAREWCERHAGTGTMIPRLIGFCMLVKREVFDRIGGFDLRFGIGNFEDDDFCLRAAVSGFHNWMCHDSFVHHFGSRTFTAEKIDYLNRLEESWRHFERKWNPRPFGGEDGSIAGYDAGELIATTMFDTRRHYCPLVGELDRGELMARFSSRGTSVLALADRRRPDRTRVLLEGALGTIGAEDPATLVIRIDPQDRTSAQTLEELADERGESVPDIVLIEARDTNDEAVVRACDLVLTGGPHDWSRAGLARWCGVAVCDVAGLGTALARRAA